MILAAAAAVPAVLCAATEPLLVAVGNLPPREFVAGVAEDRVRTEPLLVAVSILPQQEFVAKVGRDRVRIEVLVRPGHSPATYEPSPKQMTRLAGTRFWIRIGAPFERAVLRNLPEVAPGLAIVDGRRGIDLIEVNGHSDHSSVPGGEPDPHFWLDPFQVKAHARTIRDALCERDPDHCDAFTANLSDFHRELERAHESVSATLAPIAGRELFVFHPSYGYFARRYGLRQVAVEAGGRTPTGRQLAALVDRAQASGVRALFVQPQFAGSSVKALADAMGVGVVELDPLAPDYLQNLETMATKIAAAYRE
jgi:zinc transport system substrate-binding protein